MTSESKIKQIINILTTLKEVTESESMSREQCDRANAKSIEESNINIGETKSELIITQGEMEETAITVADFLAEYYLSQLGVDDFEMEGGEEE